MVGNPEFRAMLERAGKVWSRRIVDTWTAWDRPAGELKGYLVADTKPLTAVRVGAGGETSTGLVIDVRDANLTDANAWSLQNARGPDDVWEPRFGSIEVNRAYLSEAAEAQLFSTLAHEIGHVLGAWTATSVLQDQFASYIDEAAGTWTGPNVTALHGGPAPFQDSSNPDAWVGGERAPSASQYDFKHSGVCASLMAYCRHGNALRPFAPDAIDVAFLADLGMTIAEETDRPETYGLAGWTAHAAFTVAVSRDLRISLAEPQPQYHGAAHWPALAVFDLLQAEVDAFGYLSAGSFAQSSAARGAEGIVRYAGGLIGAALDLPGLPPVTGNVSLAIDVASLAGAASLTALTVYPQGTPQAFVDGPLHYPVSLAGSSISGGGSVATLRADFYGPQHDEIAGVLYDARTGLQASFGASLDRRPSREDVAASGDFLAGVSIQHGSADPADDGWYQYRCGTSSACEVRDDAAGRWRPWTTTTRGLALASTAGWAWRHAAKPEADYEFLRLERYSSASTDGAQGRLVIDGLAGTLEHAAFGVGFQQSKNWEGDDDAVPSNFHDEWTGVQGSLSGSAPGGTVRWLGHMVGYQSSFDWGENPFVEGRAAVQFSLPTGLVDVDFSEVASRDGSRSVPDFGFADLPVSAGGTFEGGAGGIIVGGFFGPSQEETAGMFHHQERQIRGSFGARTGLTVDAHTGQHAVTAGPLEDGASLALADGTSGTGTTPGGLRLAERPLGNPDAADLLDHWGHRRSQTILDGLSLAAPAPGSDAEALHALRAAAQESRELPVVPNLHDGDEARLLGARRGIIYGRWAGGPGDTLSIDFDLSGAGPSLAGIPEFPAMLERAGKVWSQRIADDWAAWERSEGAFKGYLAKVVSPPIQVRVEAEREVSAGLTIDVRDEILDGEAAGWAVQGGGPPGESWEPRFGSIEIDREYLARDLDSELFAVLTHEIGHVLGAWTVSSRAPTRFAPYVDEAAGTWSGPNVVAIHGGPAPFQDLADPHTWVEGKRDPFASQYDFAHSGVCASLMAYCRGGDALPSFLPDPIDLAFLADLGVTVSEETERFETYGLAGWSDYAAFTISVSRQLEIARADPQPHYGYQGGPWDVLDVTDLLRAEVDAFGHMSTGSFAGSRATNGSGGMVRYAGGLIGAALDRPGLPPVTGDAFLAIDVALLTGSASFTSLTVYPDGRPEPFAEGVLHYPIELSENAVLATDTGLTLQGNFYGPLHDDIAGILHDPRTGLLGSFGTTRDERPSREDVIAASDYLVGISRLDGSGEPADDGWYNYRCATASTCESQHYGSDGWTEWAPAARDTVLAVTAGWNFRDTARPVEDSESLRFARQSKASTDGARGRHAIEGFTGTLQYASFGVGTEESSEFWMDSTIAPPDFRRIWTGVQGTQTGTGPDGAARWTGLMLGHQRYLADGDANPYVKGRVALDFVLPDNRLDVSFFDVKSVDGQRRIPDFNYQDIEVEADGTFRQEGGARLRGAFLGPSHEEAVGVIDHSATRILGSFGVRLEAAITASEAGGHGATQAPIVDLGDQWHIGANVAPPADQLVTVGEHHGVTVASGSVQDGVTADEVLAYLATHMGGELVQAGMGFTFGSGIPGLPTFSDPPTVRLADGTPKDLAQHVSRAVELINAALPYEQRIVFSSDPAPPLAPIATIPDGQVFVDFAPSAKDWNLRNSDYRPGAAGISEVDPIQEFNTDSQRWEYLGMRAAHVWMDSERIMNAAWVQNPETGIFEETLLADPVIETDQVRKVYPHEDVFSIVLHELVHALGFLAHNDADHFPNSIMRDNYLLVTKHMPRIDGDALLAAYDRLEPGALPDDLNPENLGPWADTSSHLHGTTDFDGGTVSFGVASRNGLAQPWVSGPQPLADLADNSALFGTVTWNGALLGATPLAEAVVGGVLLAVELANLSGKLEVTDMEHWDSNSAPGMPGSGAIWGDGDLGYTIKVHENTFTQTGGDDGYVTGAFFGRSHEAMGGVLERSDLSAAFGGER